MKGATVNDSVSKSNVWSIAINENEIKIEPSSVVVIGRKPMRPVAVPEGAQRVDIVDATKSMSKNHAKITVDAQGVVELSDLGSTNGTYIRNDSDKLLRIPAENPYTVTADEINGQFGDVTFNLRRVTPLKQSEASEKLSTEDRRNVEDLFSYQSPLASEEVPQGTMSVDDILDLRAGEPTAVFSTQRTLDHNEQKMTEDADFSDDDEADNQPEVNEISKESDENQDSHDSQEIDSYDQAHIDTGVTELAAINADSGYMPVYEPGSVFDRLSRGDFDKKEDVIEVDGHSSDEAKHTRDFNAQFEIAQLRQLRPFLALNPFLYDDLFAWLEAQNDADIDTALNSNEGFIAWKKGTK